MVYWFFGFPGVGKDYCAKAFTELISASYLHIDDILSAQDKEKLLNGTFSVEDRIKKLKRATTQINQLLRSNGTVVAADSLPDHRSREFLLKNFKNDIIFVRVVVDSQIHKKRFAKRKNHFFTEDLLNDWIKKHWQEPIKIPHVVLNNNTDGKEHITETLKEIL